MKPLSTRFLVLSLFLLITSEAWSEEPEPVTPVQQTLEALRMDLSRATQLCQNSINQTKGLEAALSSKSPFWKTYFWKTPHPWFNVFTCWGNHHAACKKLDNLKLDHHQFKETMMQFNAFSEKFEEKAKKDIDNYKDITPIQTFAREVQEVIGALGTGCKNMSQALDAKLNERAQLIDKIYTKSEKIETPL